MLREGKGEPSAQIVSWSRRGTRRRSCRWFMISRLGHSRALPLQRVSLNRSTVRGSQKFSRNRRSRKSRARRAAHDLGGRAPHSTVRVRSILRGSRSCAASGYARKRWRVREVHVGKVERERNRRYCRKAVVYKYKVERRARSRRAVRLLILGRWRGCVGHWHSQRARAHVHATPPLCSQGRAHRSARAQQHWLGTHWLRPTVACPGAP